MTTMQMNRPPDHIFSAQQRIDGETLKCASGDRRDIIDNTKRVMLDKAIEEIKLECKSNALAIEYNFSEQPATVDDDIFSNWGNSVVIELRCNVLW